MDTVWSVGHGIGSLQGGVRPRTRRFSHLLELGNGMMSAEAGVMKRRFKDAAMV